MTCGAQSSTLIKPQHSIYFKCFKTPPQNGDAPEHSVFGDFQAYPTCATPQCLALKTRQQPKKAGEKQQPQRHVQSVWPAMLHSMVQQHACSQPVHRFWRGILRILLGLGWAQCVFTTQKPLTLSTRRAPGTSGWP